jgi:hypothetical protein
MNPTNTDSNAAADSATATNEPEGFESFERRQLGLFREVESIAASWGLAVVIRDFRRGRTSAAALALLVGTSAHRTPKHPDAARCFALIAADLEHIFAQEFEARNGWPVCSFTSCARSSSRLGAIGGDGIARASAMRRFSGRPPRRVSEADDSSKPSATNCAWVYHEARFLRACARMRGSG